MNRIAHFKSLVEDQRVGPALFVVNHLGIFHHLLVGMLGAVHLAELCRVHERKLRPFLDILAVSGCLNKNGDRYGLIDADKEIFKQGRLGFLDLEKIKNSEIFQKVSDALEVLQSGHGRLVAASGAMVPQIEREQFQSRIHKESQEVAFEVAQLLSQKSSGKLLDVGCGAGTYSWAFLQMNPQTEAVMLDRGNSKHFVEKLAKEKKLEGRYRFAELDLNVDNWGSGYQLILASNFLHCLSDKETLKFFEFVRKSLSPGGFLVIKDYVIEDERTGPMFALAFDIDMAIYSNGHLWSLTELKTYIKNYPDLQETESLLLRTQPDSFVTFLKKSL